MTPLMTAMGRKQTNSQLGQPSHRRVVVVVVVEAVEAAEHGQEHRLFDSRRLVVSPFSNARNNHGR